MYLITENMMINKYLDGMRIAVFTIALFNLSQGKNYETYHTH